jgi:hypothetical protein
MKFPATQAMLLMSKRLANEPLHAESQSHYPMAQQWSTNNAFIYIHIKHRDTA